MVMDNFYTSNFLGWLPKYTASAKHIMKKERNLTLKFPKTEVKQSFILVSVLTMLSQSLVYISEP